MSLIIMVGTGYGTAAVEMLTCGPTAAIASLGPAFTLAVPAKVVVVQFEVPASRVETVVPDATKVPAGVAATGRPEFN